MKRIRINNDFTFAWAIERNGLPEDLSTAINMVLRARNSTGALQTITDYDVAGNIVSVEVTPEIANVLGRYNFILTYELPDASLDDMERLCEIDTDAFILVPRTAEADDSTDLLVTSDMAIGFKGDKGDNEYVTWLSQGNEGTYDDYLAVLQQPATEAAGTLTEAVNLKLGEADTAIQNADTKATLANTATNLANAKAALADAAALNADAKAALANTAANLANAAAAAIEPAVIDNEQVQAETYNNLHARISALEEMTRNGVYSYIQAETIVGVQSLQFKGAELILTGTAAPAIAPDFVGQVFVNTTSGVTYTAKGIASAADWKQTSN